VENNHVAGAGLRLFASFLDVLILTTISDLLYFVIKGEYSIDWMNKLTWQLSYTFYLTITPVLWSGYIIGKRICKIKVKRMDNENVKLSNMILREVIGYFLIGFVTFGLSIVVSIFMMMFREDKRGIHDFIGGTYVARS
jgi:uncharacterized RDD family membrane protein YckC